MVILVVSGCPGSGKSTLLKQIGETIEADQILRQLGGFSVENYHRAKQVMHEAALNKIRNQQDALIDDTNHLRSMVKFYRNLAKTHCVGWVHVILEVPLDLATERNNSRSDKVDVATLQKIHSQLSQENFFRESIRIGPENPIERVKDLLESPLYLNKEQQKLRHFSCQNLVHQVDLALRKHIKEIILNTQKDKRQNTAVLCSQCKENTLACTRSGLSFKDSLAYFFEILDQINLK